MRGLLGIVVLVILAICAWRVANVISPDSVSMAVGMLFGVLAGIPTAALVSASGRRRYREDWEDSDDSYPDPAPPSPQKTTITVLPVSSPAELPANRWEALEIRPKGLPPLPPVRKKGQTVRFGGWVLQKEDRQ